MSHVTYTVVEHDGGWAYKQGDVFSEPYPSHDEALAAARRAASEQQVGGPDEAIRYQDSKGEWHDERAAGGDRPETDVVD